MTEYSEIQSLDQLMGGALNERFNAAFKDILKNCFDPNTDPEKVRKIKVTIFVKPDGNRDAAKFGFDIKAEPAAPTAVTQTVYIHQKDDGSVEAVEKTNVAPGQVGFDGKEYIPNVIEFNRKPDA
ncbi:hypothetical protein AGMMS49992_22220 [Clostridia bacterium]|nr:hypothetical protein AGMMS49992_22220 [Clostridia bacterium]